MYLKNSRFKPEDNNVKVNQSHFLLVLNLIALRFELIYLLTFKSHNLENT